MTESHQPEDSAGQQDTQQDQTEPEEDATGAESSAATQPAEGADTSAADTEAQDSPTAAGKSNKKGLLLGLTGGGVVVVIVVLVLAAFVWPGFLAGPGKPDDKAAATTAALASKNSDELEKVSCHGPDGKSMNKIPPQAMQLIQSAKQTGPPQLLLDTEAQAPVDLTLSAQGQTQTVPANAVLGVTDNEWCMKGISQRQ